MASKHSPRTAAPLEVIDHPQAEPAELVDTRGDGNAIQVFLRNIGAVFAKGTELELAAKATLETAEKLQPPATAEQDVAIQLFIKRARADQKTIEENWQVAQLFHQAHKRLTSIRGRGTALLDKAMLKAQTLHNNYTAAEERRAREEEDRRRRAAEDQARLDRERELAELERQRVKAEEASGELSTRELAFVVSMVANPGMSATQAAQRAGYKEPLTLGPRLLASAKIQGAIKAQHDAAALRRQAAAVAAMPLEVSPIEEVAPNIARAAGAADRSTWSGEIVDEAATMAALLGGRHGIPQDLFQINPVKLNEYARSLQSRLDLWPGVRAKKSTKTI